MRRLLAALVAVVVALAPFQTEAGPASPTERLRGFFTSAARAIEDPRAEITLEDRLRTIRALVRDIFDFREAARLSLGAEWSARTPAERAEFVGLFADILERSFIGGIAARIRLVDGVQVSFIDESVEGGQATVRTAVAAKSGVELPFHYRMVELGQRWAVRDVVIDGVSIAANYRAQFGRIMQTSSYAELVRQLRARVSGTSMFSSIGAAEAASLPPVALLESPAVEVARPAVGEATLARPAPVRITDAAPREIVVARVAAVPVVVAPPPPPVQIEPEPIEAEPEQEPEPAAAEEPSPEPVAELSEVRETSRQPEIAPAPAPTAAPRLSRSRSYWVQVGAFANLAAARRLAAALEEQAPALPPNRWIVVIEPADTGAELAKVRVGPFAGRFDAAAKLRDVQGYGYKPFIAEERD